MTEKILRSQSEIPDASMADLLATYNALTGQSVRRFSSRAVGEGRVRMAILAATDAAGHAGVPRGTVPLPKTQAELRMKAAELAKLEEHTCVEPTPVPPPADGNPYPKGSTESGLWYTARKAEAALRLKPPVKKRQKRTTPPFVAVRATFAGSSKPQAASLRAEILRSIQGFAPKGVTIEALNALYEAPVRSYVQKLMEKKHVEPCSKEDCA
jgi:hypothetical protein